MHRTIVNMARCMIFGSGVALIYWNDEAEYASQVLNRSPTRSNTETHVTAGNADWLGAEFDRHCGI